MKESVSILLMIVFCFVGAHSVSAQSASQPEGNSLNISLSASVVDAIELLTIRSMRFADAQPSEGEIFINPVTSNNAGQMKALGQENANVRITFLQERELIHSSGTHTLDFRYEVSVNTENDQSTSELINNENRNFQMSENGELYIWVGGSVNIQDAQPGSYQGEFTLEIEYI